MSNSNLRASKVNPAVSVYVGSAQDRLAAVLNAELSNEPDADTQRVSDTAAAHSRVDAARQWGAISKVGLDLIAEGAALSATIAGQFPLMRPDAFGGYKTGAMNGWYGRELSATDQVRGLLADVRAAFPIPAIPYPITTADITAMSARLHQLSTASPQEAKLLVMDAVNRGDIPFLAAAGSAIRSYISHKNSWANNAAQQIAVDLLESIDSSSWTPAVEAAEYCEQRAQDFTTAWRYLATTLSNDLRLDPMHRQSGALSPMLDPIDNSSVTQSLATAAAE